MEMGIRKFNEFILNFEAFMADAQNEVQSMAALWYAICNQEKEKRARIINKLATYGQKLAHRTRKNTILSYTRRHRVRAHRKGLLTTRATPAFIIDDIEDLCSPKKKKKRGVNRKGAPVLISPQPLTGGKTNRVVQRNPTNKRSAEDTEGTETIGCPKDRSSINAAAGASNSRHIPQSKRSEPTAQSEGQERNAVAIQETGRIPTEKGHRRNERTGAITENISREADFTAGDTGSENNKNRSKSTTFSTSKSQKEKKPRSHCGKGKNTTISLSRRRK